MAAMYLDKWRCDGRMWGYFIFWPDEDGFLDIWNKLKYGYRYWYSVMIHDSYFHIQYWLWMIDIDMYIYIYLYLYNYYILNIIMWYYMEIVDIDSWSSSTNFTFRLGSKPRPQRQGEHCQWQADAYSCGPTGAGPKKWTGADRGWILLQRKSPFLMGKSPFLRGKLTLNHHFQ